MESQSWKLLRAVPVLIAAAGASLVSAPVVAAESARASNQIIEEITVTARKREERVIDTPVAVSVMGEDDIDRYNARDLTQLTKRIPGLEVSHGGGGGAGGNITIRGIGKPPGTSDYGIDAPVSLVIDGMPFSRNHMILTGFFDSEAVEVLKGPQALYYGKNTPAGVINIRSNTPEVGGEREGFIRASYEFVSEDPVAEVGFSLPVGDHWAFRIAARGQDADGGWLKNTAQVLDASALYPGTSFQTGGPSYDEYPAQKQAVVRFTAVWEPTETFNATLKAFRSYTKRNDASTTVLYACADGPGTNPYYGAGFAVIADPTQTCQDNRARLERNGALPVPEVADSAINFDRDDRYYYKLDQYVHTLQMNWDIGDYTLSSSTGYWDYRHREFTNYDYTSWGIVTSKQGEEGEAFTQELRLASNFDGPINFTIGGFFEDAERNLSAPVHITAPFVYEAFAAALPGVPGFDPPPALPFDGPGAYNGTYFQYHQIWDNDIESISFFGSFDWEVSEKLEISGGLRWTEEDREAIGGNVHENSGFFGFSPAGFVYNPSQKSDNVSPELTFSYHINDDLMTYASYRTGFQSAGISNPGTVANLSSLPVDVQNDTLIFDETEIEGFEVGLKGTFLDGRMRADLAAFWYEMTDLQVGIFNSNTTSFTLQNAAVAHNLGFEVNTIFQVNERLQLRLSGQYNKLEYDEWEDAGCHSIDGALPAAVLAARTGEGSECYIGPDGVPIQDLSGLSYGGPPLQVNVGFTYDVPLMSGWGLELNWDTIHHNKGKKTINQPFTAIPSRTVTHIAATLRQEGGPVEASLICSNCFNEIYVTSIGNKPLQKINAGVNGDMTAGIQPPRLLTLQVTYRL
ncbi:MAG: TonB-dependent receptor [Gammaproteobacteria bacterium]|nr:TonB-dependent receptor [Gammaproteobacteria bacterium]